MMGEDLRTCMRIDVQCVRENVALLGYLTQVKGPRWDGMGGDGVGRVGMVGMGWGGWGWGGEGGEGGVGVRRVGRVWMGLGGADLSGDVMGRI